MNTSISFDDVCNKLECLDNIGKLRWIKPNVFHIELTNIKNITIKKLENIVNYSISFSLKNQDSSSCITIVNSEISKILSDDKDGHDILIEKKDGSKILIWFKCT